MKTIAIKETAQMNKENMIVLNEKEMEQVNGGLTGQVARDENGDLVIVFKK